MPCSGRWSSWPRRLWLLSAARPPADPSPRLGSALPPPRPDQATVTVNAVELARLGEPLTDVEAVRGTGVADPLADFSTHRGPPHPRVAAATLIDAVCFTAPGLRPRRAIGGHPEGESR